MRSKPPGAIPPRAGVSSWTAARGPRPGHEGRRLGARTPRAPARPGTSLHCGGARGCRLAKSRRRGRRLRTAREGGWPCTGRLRQAAPRPPPPLPRPKPPRRPLPGARMPAPGRRAPSLTALFLAADSRRAAPARHAGGHGWRALAGPEPPPWAIFLMKMLASGFADQLIRSVDQLTRSVDRLTRSVDQLTRCSTTPSRHLPPRGSAPAKRRQLRALEPNSPRRAQAAPLGAAAPAGCSRPRPPPFTRARPVTGPQAP